MRHQPPFVVFSSLDAIPVDADRSLPEPVAEALKRLKEDGIPLVLHSTKTRAQLECIYQEIEMSHPFLVENGAAVFIPDGYFRVDLPSTRTVAGYQAVEFGRPYAQVVEALHWAASRLGIDVLGFDNMSVDEVARECGLSLLQARLAKLRAYDEPFRVLEPAGDARQRLAKTLRAAKLQCSNRGRYDHVGAARDPAGGVNLLCGLFQRMVGSPLTIGLGEHASDAAWLHRMDVPLIVTSSTDAAVTQRLCELVPQATLTAASGMIGWADFLVSTLNSARS